MIQPNSVRRLLLASLAVPALQGCGTPLPMTRGGVTTPEAQALLAQSAAAHGLDAWSKIEDLSISYAGAWRPVVGRLQPALVDAGFRGRSEERVLPRERLTAQAHEGPEGRKQVVRRTVVPGTRGPGARGDVRVWYNGEETRDTARRDAAALVVDGYALFLLGPLVLAQYQATDRALVMEVAAPERIVLEGREHTCDVLRVHMTPGNGLSDADQLALFIDREQHVMRRARFTLNGLESTRSAVAEVDTFEHITRHGVRWPTRFHERLLRPLALPVHDWRLTGLDINRGLKEAEVSGAVFGARAAVPAAALV